jgi:toxin ParE1/3/4
VKVRYTAPALADLDSILSYIVAHSPQGANRVQARACALSSIFLRFTIASAFAPTIRSFVA